MSASLSWLRTQLDEVARPESQLPLPWGLMQFLLLSPELANRIGMVVATRPLQLTMIKLVLYLHGIFPHRFGLVMYYLIEAPGLMPSQSYWPAFLFIWNASEVVSGRTRLQKAPDSACTLQPLRI